MLQELSSLHTAFAHVCLEVVLEYWFLQQSRKFTSILEIRSVEREVGIAGFLCRLSVSALPVPCCSKA